MKAIELMCPAGNMPGFMAALESGADSIYLGYKKLNARRPAQNFDVNQLCKITELAHSKNKKIYLTLNIDLKSNELHEACQLLELAEKINIDAVIIKDPALLYYFQNQKFHSLQLHLSTQCAVTSSLGVIFAAQNAVRRVVLARELDLNEIREINLALDSNRIKDPAGHAVETEIFTEGSMCFSISGRCLISSWGGGHSGNRGACVAPCRMSWKNRTHNQPFFAMKDLSLVDVLDQVVHSGVSALKIEGRLKNAAWVRAVTRLYRVTMDRILQPFVKQAEREAEQQEEIEQLKGELKKYSARETGPGHLFGHDHLLGHNQDWQSYQKTQAAEQENETAYFKSVYQLSIQQNDGQLKVILKIEKLEEQFFIDLPRPPRKAKTIPFLMIKQLLKQGPLSPQLTIQVHDIDLMLSSQQLSKICKQIQKRIIQLLKQVNSLPRLDQQQEQLIRGRVQEERVYQLGGLPDQIMILNSQIGAFLEQKTALKSIVVELGLVNDLQMIKALARLYPLILSIPAILFPNQARAMQSIVQELYENGFDYFQANSLTGFQILSALNCRKAVGPGFPVINHLAAQFFYARGFESVYVSPEGDRSVFKSLSSFSQGKINSLVFAKLPLFIARVNDQAFKNLNQFRDKIGIELECWSKNDLNYFVSSAVFQLMGQKVKNESIYFDQLTADLRYFKEPLKTFSGLLQGKKMNLTTGSFNFFNKLL